MDGTEDTQCTEVSNGLRCQRQQYRAQNGELWDHPGGHLFSTPEAMRILRDEHVDAEAFLAGRPMAHHRPIDCPGDGFCAWRMVGRRG